MRCPQCGERETRVVDSRDLDDSATIRRRRECAACAMRFTTYERVEAARLVVIKRDGARQEFDRDRLVSGLRKALTRRPVPDGAAEAAADAIEAELRAAGVTEVPSSRIGALAMEQLRGIDQIAYIRFASVYQSFEDLEALKREVDTLYAERGDTSPSTCARRPAARSRAMSVLSDRDIRAALEAGAVRIDPYDPHDLQPSSVDLHLDKSFRVFRNNRYPFIDVRAPAAGPDRAADRRRGRAVHPAPGRIRPRPDPRVGRAAERPRGPARRARVFGRLGLLIHSTAGYVDPGWKGNLTLELSNVANLPIALYFGMRIGQISFFQMSSPVDRPYGSPELGSKYQGQSEPTASAFHRDFDAGRRDRRDRTRK